MPPWLISFYQKALSSRLPLLRSLTSETSSIKYVLSYQEVIPLWLISSCQETLPLGLPLLRGFTFRTSSTKYVVNLDPLRFLLVNLLSSSQLWSIETFTWQISRNIWPIGTLSIASVEFLQCQYLLNFSNCQMYLDLHNTPY